MPPLPIALIPMHFKLIPCFCLSLLSKSKSDLTKLRRTHLLSSCKGKTQRHVVYVTCWVTLNQIIFECSKIFLQWLFFRHKINLCSRIIWPRRITRGLWGNEKHNLVSLLAHREERKDTSRKDRNTILLLFTLLVTFTDPKIDLQQQMDFTWITSCSSTCQGRSVAYAVASRIFGISNHLMDQRPFTKS